MDRMRSCFPDRYCVWTLGFLAIGEMALGRDMVDCWIEDIDMRIGALVQARMSSRRLPNKVLRPLGDKPLLGHLLQRLSMVPCLDLVAVATSSEHSDDPIEVYCNNNGVPCYRGGLGDVARRLLDAASAFGLDAFVRVCGDSPLLAPSLVERAVDLFFERQPDLVTNCLPKRFPAGQSVEVVSVEALTRAYAQFVNADHYEHVTKYLYEHTDHFSIQCIETDADYSGVHFAVDTPNDLIGMSRIVENPCCDCSLSVDELVALYRAVVGVQGGGL